jgi:Dyp-type peroxidase family
MSQSKSRTKSSVNLSKVQGNILHGFDKPNVRLIFFSFGISTFDDDRIKDEKARTVMRWIGEIALRDVLASTATIKKASKDLHDSRLKDPNYLPQELWLHISLSAPGIRKFRVGNKYLPLPPSTDVYEGVWLQSKLKDSAQLPETEDLHHNDAVPSWSRNPDPFALGMKSRAAWLGDVGKSDTKNWDSFYKNDDELDALFIAAADQEDDLDIFVVKLIAEAAQKGVRCIGIERGRAMLNEQGKQVEHFGFRDGVSQPLIKGVDDEKIHRRKFYGDVFYPEDFVLFDLQGDLSWANNGSFLVFRKLEQDVQAFWDYLKQKIEDRQMKLSPEDFAAKIVGRWKSGAPLAEYSSHDPVDPSDADKNDFAFAGRKVLTSPIDIDGKLTPLFAHTRITNPRDMSPSGTHGDPAANLKDNAQHRILRRGIPYGPPWATNQIAGDHPKRGLLFICYQRDIGQQFEFIQKQLTNYSKPQYTKSPHAEIEQLFSEGYKHIMEEWVTTKGGGYFFSPSIPALRKLEKLLVSSKPSQKRRKTKPGPH